MKWKYRGRIYLIKVVLFFFSLLQIIVSYPPTKQLTYEEQDLVWKFRYYLTNQEKVSFLNVFMYQMYLQCLLLMNEVRHNLPWKYRVLVKFIKTLQNNICDNQFFKKIIEVDTQRHMYPFVDAQIATEWVRSEA